MNLKHIILEVDEWIRRANIERPDTHVYTFHVFVLKAIRILAWEVWKLKGGGRTVTNQKLDTDPDLIELYEGCRSQK